MGCNGDNSIDHLVHNGDMTTHDGNAMGICYGENGDRSAAQLAISLAVVMVFEVRHDLIPTK